jgi:SAM-dependent methyltransferase
MEIPMNKKQYANFWEPESNNFNSNKIYEILSKQITNGKVLEIGCGIGLGTYNLSQNHEVLSLDNNKYLIEKAINYLESQDRIYQIHNCELFQLTQDDKNIIQQFKPNIIVGWFLGASGETVNKYTPEENNVNSKGKLYREKLEDIIVSNNLLIDSVDTINLAIRSGKVHDSSKEEMFITQKQDYDTYVFKNVGFEVVNVEVIDWNTTNSDFRYSSVPNPNVANKNLIPTIISITAKRIK